jgi:hypothetical protein
VAGGAGPDREPVVLCPWSWGATVVRGHGGSASEGPLGPPALVEGFSRIASPSRQLLGHALFGGCAGEPALFFLPRAVVEAILEAWEDTC